MAVFSSYSDPPKVFLCKHGKKTSKVKKFIKKHKKAIIIGTIVVIVAVTVVVCVVAAPAATSAAVSSIRVAGAAAEAALPGSSSSENDTKNSSSSTITEENSSLSSIDSPETSISPITSTPSSNIDAVEDESLLSREQYVGSQPQGIFDDVKAFSKLPLVDDEQGLEVFLTPEVFQRMSRIMEDAPILQEALERQVLQLQEESACNDYVNKSLSAREVGSYIAHDVLDEVAELMVLFPEALGEIKQISEKILPDNMLLKDNCLFGGPKENYEKTVMECHEAIDKIFSTDYAENYSPCAKELKALFGAQKTEAVLPPPGDLFAGSTGKDVAKKVAKNSNQAIQAGRALEKEAANFTEALVKTERIQAIKTEREVLEVIKPDGRWIGAKGSRNTVRIFQGNKEDAERLFQKLTKDGKFHSSGVDRTTFVLEDGTHISYREVSTSGPPTIDVKLPKSDQKIKLKFKE